VNIYLNFKKSGFEKRFFFVSFRFLGLDFFFVWFASFRFASFPFALFFKLCLEGSKLSMSGKTYWPEKGLTLAFFCFILEEKLKYRTDKNYHFEGVFH
jgi:hypothetical protein